jgi:hypothetical protein
MRKLIHRISHWLGWNCGTVETRWRDGNPWVGFKCCVCGEVQGEHKTRIKSTGV